MKTSLAAFALVLALVAAAAPGGAGANGSPFSPGLVHGWEGVPSRSRDVRYVTLDTETSTLVAVIRTDGGRVERTKVLRGHYSIPLVAYDGTPGGLSGNGKRLVVSSYGPAPGTLGSPASRSSMRRACVCAGSSVSRARTRSMQSPRTPRRSTSPSTSEPA